MNSEDYDIKQEHGQKKNGKNKSKSTLNKTSGREKAQGQQKAKTYRQKHGKEHKNKLKHMKENAFKKAQFVEGWELRKLLNF